MSRSVRDLRELICVSRLTIRDSDEEIVSDEENIARDFDSISISSTSSVDSQKAVATPAGHTSPDSGCITNGSTPPEPVQGVDAPPQPKSTKAKKRKKKEKKKALDLIPNRHELPRPEPLPPLAASSSSMCMTEYEVDAVSRPMLNPGIPAHNGNFDDMLCYMDATVVSSWLTRANENVSVITDFCRNCENFVRFAHFWLSDFPDQQKSEIFELEMGILMEELSFAFAVGKEQRKVNHRDINRLIGAVFREYPNKLLSMKGPHLFLDYLDVLSSDKRSSYKKILSDVKCSTRNKQYAQWLLATRSFALVSVWSAVLNFYKNLLGKGEGVSVLRNPTPEGTVHHQRLVQAIRLGFVDVLHYYITSNLVSPYQKDSHNRTYLFTAVTYNQSKVLHYLINRVKPPIDVNCAADTGNTPLHAAANNGNVELVTMLLQNPRIDLNCKNPQCENATPLHLAVMMGNKEVVEKLLKLGADQKLKMGDLMVEDIARDFGHSDLLPLFVKK